MTRAKLPFFFIFTPPLSPASITVKTVETGFRYTAEASLKLPIFLPQPHKLKGYRHMALSLSWKIFKQCSDSGTKLNCQTAATGSLFLTSGRCP